MPNPIGRAGFGAFYWSSWVWGFPTGRAAKWVPSIWLCLFRDYGHSYGNKVQFFVVSSVTYMHFAVMHLVGGGGRGWPRTAEVQLHAYWLDVCSRVVLQIFSLQNWIKIGFSWKSDFFGWQFFKIKDNFCGHCTNYKTNIFALVLLLACSCAMCSTVHILTRLHPLGGGALPTFTQQSASYTPPASQYFYR